MSAIPILPLLPEKERWEILWEGKVVTKESEAKGKCNWGWGMEKGAQVGTHSAGRHQVLGKKWKSLGNIFNMRFIFLASKSLRQISLIPGK